MLESISQIKDKVHSSMYETEGRKTYDVDSIVAELKKDEKFKNFKENELYSYAYGLIANHNAHALKGALQSMGFDTGKPQDPFWSQYTYEEILNMVNDGVQVPQEFIDWAYTMQDSDTTAYQIEDSSEDPNAYDNLAGETGNIDQSDIQKRAQAFASKAQAQEKLINNKVEETKPILNTVLAEKNELEKNQKSALENLASMTKEWKTLDRKFKSGTPLSEAEQNKYQELGLALNDSNNGILLQTKKVSDDIEELMTQIDSIDMLLGVNEKINAEIEDIGTRMSWFEGNKKHIILPTSNGNQVTGLSAAFYVAAMGNNLAYDTGLAGVNLFFNNMEVQNQQEIHLNTAVQTQKQVDVVNNAADNQDDNLKYTTNKQSENKNDDNKTEQNNNPQNGVQQQETDANEIINPEKTQPKTPQADAKVPVQTEEPLISQEEPENTLTKALNSENNPKTNAINAQFNSKVAENTDNAQTQQVAADTTVQTSAQAAQTTETESAEDTAATDEAGEVTETPDTSVETEDPLKAETSQMVSECENRNNAMVQAEQQIQAKVEEVKKIRANKSKDDAQLKNELTKAVTEYDNLAQKVQNGETLSDNEQKRVKALEKAINAKNGTIITKIKDKVTALTGFADALNNDIQQTKANQEFGEQAVAKGKEYAKATLGDREYLKDSMFGFVHFSQLPKEKQYDLLYGKKGESVGRDAIDNGELLISNAAASQERLAKSLPLAGFAMNYSQELNTKLSETNQKVNAIKQNLQESAEQQADNTNGPSNAEGENSSSKKSKKKDEVTKEDGQKIEQQGRKVEQEGKEAKKDGQDAKKDKQATDKQIKKETAALKSDEKRIVNYTKDSQQINQQFEEMSIELDAILEAKAQASTEQESPAMQAGPAPARALNARGANPRSVGLNNSAPAQNMNDNMSSQNDNNAKLMAMAAAVPNLEKRLKTNDKTINTISKAATAKNKKLNKLYNLKYKQAQADMRAKEKSMKKNEKLQSTVTKTGYMFTGTKLTGLALMSMPWSAAVGAYMYGIGKYGEITCYVTNAAIDVANGNFLGALVNVGAAALSYFTGPKTIGPANAAVKGAATEGAKEVAKETGKEAVKEGTKEVGKEVAKEGTKEIGKEVGKGALTASTSEIISSPLKQLAQSSMDVMLSSATEMMKETTKAVSQQLAKEAAKQALKETVKNVALNAATAAMPTLVAMTHKEKVAEPQKKQRRLLSYQERRARQAKMDKIERTTKILTSRGQKKR